MASQVSDCHLPFLGQLGFISLFSSFNSSLRISREEVLTASQSSTLISK